MLEATQTGKFLNLYDDSRAKNTILHLTSDCKMLNINDSGAGNSKKVVESSDEK
ncbi:hypothetical protein BofuT4_uP151450.1 [Botrytis cinerea T4]|uniref:Uncharacterized protein n=1 Tax=Botryotinia fuckeliana (strain T4) TaxID=999810 RepID=G2YWL5_BOTF4|nr:hypothetical protein BofuT4_uP151450.1 [Botrytis cinerea T4]